MTEVFIVNLHHFLLEEARVFVTRSSVFASASELVAAFPLALFRVSAGNNTKLNSNRNLGQIADLVWKLFLAKSSLSFSRSASWLFSGVKIQIPYFSFSISVTSTAIYKKYCDQTN